MKKAFFVTSMLLIGSQAFAAKLDSCLKEVTQRCGSASTLIGLASVDSNQCSIVQQGTREDGTQFAKKVIFKDSNSIVSIEFARCSFSTAQVPGQFLEQKQYLGRLFSVLEDGRVVVVGRDNRIVMLINSKEKPYSNVTDIKVEDQTITLTLKTKEKLEQDAQDVLRKLNHPAAQLY